MQEENDTTGFVQFKRLVAFLLATSFTAEIPSLQSQDFFFPSGNVLLPLMLQLSSLGVFNSEKMHI